MQLYGQLSTALEAQPLPVAGEDDVVRVCVGKEWYRFPSRCDTTSCRYFCYGTILCLTPGRHWLIPTLQLLPSEPALRAILRS